MKSYSRNCWSKLAVLGLTVGFAITNSNFQNGMCQENPAKVLTDNSPQPADKSLTAEEYVQKGVPSHDRDWSGNDMKIAADAFAALAKEDLTHLPRANSKSSEKVFARIISDDNLRLFKDKSVPVQQRLGSCVVHMEANRLILTTYLEAFQNNAVSDRDLLDNLESTLRASVVMLDLAEEFISTLDKNEPSYPARMKGLEKMKQGFTSIVSGAIVSLTDSNSFSPKEIRRFAGKLKGTFPRLFQILTDETHEEYMLQLKGFAQDDAMKFMRPELEELLKTIEG